MELMVVNWQVGISSFEKNTTPFGFLKIPLNPNSRIALNRKKLKKNQIFSVKASNLIDVEKQFEFRPAFDEYLKTMESVKAVRESIPDKDGEERLGLGQEGEKKGKDLKLGEERTTRGSGQRKFEYRENGMNVRHVKVMRQDGRSMDKINRRWTNDVTTKGERFQSKYEFEYRERDSETRTNRGLGQQKFEYRENGRDVRYVKGITEDDKSMDRRRTNGAMAKNQRLQRKFEYGQSESESYEGVQSIDRTNGRWMNGVTTKDQRRAYRNSNADVRIDEVIDGEDLDHKRRYTNKQKEKRSLNDCRPTTSGREVQRMTNFSGIRKWVPEGQRSYRSSTGSKTSESTLHHTLMDWEESSRSGHGVEFDEPRNWKTKHLKELPHRNEVDEQVCDFDIRGRNVGKSSYRSQSEIGSDRNVFRTEKLGFRSAKTHLRLDDHIRTEDRRSKLSPKGGNITRSSRFSKEDIDENNVDMEMAAFKSFEVFTDVRGQPRVLRMEMEERIQHLAKWLNGTDIDMPQWLFSKMMHSAGIRFSDHSILRVIQILGTFGNWRRVLQVIEWLQSRERFKSYKSRFIYTTALDVLGKAKRPVEALNVFHAMREGVSSYPDLAAYHCIAVTLGQAGHTKELFDVIDCMRSPPQKKFNTGYIQNWDPRLEPDVVVYNVVLNACARRKQWEGAF